MTSETMQAALEAEGLCWSIGPRGVVLVDAANEYASLSARNVMFLDWYVETAVREGVSEATLATALRANLDGNPSLFAAILNP